MTTISIQLESEIVENLKTFGKKGENYNDIIRRLIDEVNYEAFMRSQYKILDEEDQWASLDDL